MTQSAQQPPAAVEKAAGPAPRRPPTFAALNKKAASPPPIETIVPSSDPPKETAPERPAVGLGYGPVLVPPPLLKDQPPFKFTEPMKDAKGKGIDRGGEEPARPPVFSKPVFSKPVFTRPPSPPKHAAPVREAPLPAQDNSVEDAEATESSPYARPERVPLGQLDRAALVARFGPEAIAEDDPSQGKDTGTVYAYPPPEPQDPRWFLNMQCGIVGDEDALAQEIERVRGLVNAALIESTLAEAELDEELEGYDRLLDDIEHVAGPAFIEYLMEKAEETWLPPYEVDDYEDKIGDLPQEDTEEFTGEFTGAGFPPMEDSEMMDQTRPSDTLSYLDPSPRTSPLANRSVKRRHAIVQPELESPSKRKRSNAPEPPSSAAFRRLGVRSSHMHHGHERPAATQKPKQSSRNGSRESSRSGSRSRSHSPSQRGSDDSEPASDEDVHESESVNPYVPPPVPEYVEYEETPSPESVDSQYSDLVSPDAPMPDGWPDNMSPRWNWLKGMTCYDLYKNPISPPERRKKGKDCDAPYTDSPDDRGDDDEDEGDELQQGCPGAGTSGTDSEKGDEPKDPEPDADDDVPMAEEEQAEDSGVDVSGERAADQEMEDDADDEAEEDQLQDDEEVDQLQDDDDEGEAGPSQPVPAPVTPPRTRRARRHWQYEMSSPRQTRDPFHPTPRSRDFNGRPINHDKFRNDNGKYNSPQIS
ncbi:hypothetical protein TRAPUB_2382 [Trametes pubescens]|uniref:Uncharacterized protein n=1 Tax=Trametes pubescens TaxID=154538 RepID=A0A1M2VGW3_TRAPU|nr:hypothetical protein TRAPUB_2382 [Trametes pubescens]